MIPDKTEIQVQSTIEGEKIAMKLDENSLVHLMTVLTDIYSDPELAIVREYATNAWDSHVEAGNRQPIEITLPSSLAPFLTIKDYGVGLGRDDIAEIYSKYGASTKRETDEQQGNLGLGCKSALTYTSQFTLVGVKNGVRCQVSVSRDDEGTSTMTIVDESPTDDSNGVEVVIPIKRFNNIEEQAKSFFRFWKPGTVLINGEPPEHIDGLKIARDTIVFKDERRERTNWLVMGNVPYPIETKHFEPGLSTGYNVVVFMDIGAINHTPSREALYYTKKTKDALAQAQQDFQTNVIPAIKKDIRKAENHREALSRAVKWRKVISNKLQPAAYQYRGMDIPWSFSPGDNARAIVTEANNTVLSRHSKMKDVGIEHCAHGILVYNYSAGNFTASHKRKLLKFAEDMKIDADYFVLTEKKIDNMWIDPQRITDWETVKQIVLPREQSVRSDRVSGSYDGYVDDKGSWTFDILATDIDTTKPIIYFTKHDFYRATDSELQRLLTKHYPSCTLIKLGENRRKKFQRDFPSAMYAKDALTKAYKKLIRRTSKANILAARIQKDYYLSKALKKFDPARIDDPEMAKAIQALNKDVTNIQAEFNEFSDVLWSLPSVENVLGKPYGDDNPLKKYPLVKSNIEDHAEHCYIYMNAVYAAERKACSTQS